MPNRAGENQQVLFREDEIALAIPWLPEHFFFETDLQGGPNDPISLDFYFPYAHCAFPSWAVMGTDNLWVFRFGDFLNLNSQLVESSRDHVPNGKYNPTLPA